MGSGPAPSRAARARLAPHAREELLRARVAQLEEELEVSHRRLAEAEQLARVGSWEWDIPANRVVWSDQLYRIYGLKPQSVEPTYERFLAYVHPDDRDDVDARNHKAFADHQPFEDVKRVVRADGAEILMRTQGEVVCDADGNPIRMIGVCEDVTAEERAARISAALASIVRTTGDAIHAIDHHGRIASWNPAAAALYGWRADEVLGRGPELLVPPELAEDDRAALGRVLAGEGVLRFETTRRHRDGSDVDVAVTISPVTGADGQVTGASVIARDIGERRRLEGQLRHLAEHDALTGLLNRRRFEERLAERVVEAARYRMAGAVLALDLDGFKEVNDAHGHAAGDALMRSVAQCMRDRLRETDAIARLGGDEFAVLLPNTGRADAQALARELIDAVRHHEVEVDGRTLHTTVSIGVSVFDEQTRDAEDVLADADRAMYAAKGAGRNCIVAADDPAAAHSRHRGPVRELREGIEQDRLRLHLQPIVDLRTGEVVRHEALVRLLATDGSLVAPGAFIGIAERLGLIHAIDTWVLRRSIALLAEHPDLVLEVNVSGHSVGDHELPHTIARELAAREVDPARLVLEITETAAIANMDDARRFADALAALGCSFALDDFGAGFGSFYYLKHLPVDVLKIDGDFIAGPRSQVDELVIQSIVRIAQELGMRTVAEYVGDEETLTALRAWGVDLAQGYHVGRPFPAERLAAERGELSR